MNIEDDEAADGWVPDMELLNEWLFDGNCEATDGCIVEPDGICPHGKPSWLLKLEMV